MTFLGKLFVILNFVLGLIAAGLMIAVHISSTQWHDLYRKTDTQLKVAQANASTWESEVQKVRNEENEKVKAVQKLFDQAAGDRDRFKKDHDDLSLLYKREVTQRKELDVTRDALTAELTRRKNEIDQLNGLLASRDKKMLELEKEKTDLRNRAVLAELAAKAEHDRNLELLDQNAVLTKSLQQAKTSGSGVAGVQPNPPPEDVQGVVRATDARTGYLTISIGSDAGLTKGNTLEVYRTQPEARYLGTVRILEVRATEAVAVPVNGARRGQIQVGDLVSSTVGLRR